MRPDKLLHLKVPKKCWHQHFVSTLHCYYSVRVYRIIIVLWESYLCGWWKLFHRGMQQKSNLSSFQSLTPLSKVIGLTTPLWKEPMCATCWITISIVNFLDMLRSQAFKIAYFIPSGHWLMNCAHPNSAPLKTTWIPLFKANRHLLKTKDANYARLNWMKSQFYSWNNLVRFCNINESTVPILGYALNPVYTQQW